MDDVVLIIALYVDDMLLTSPNKTHVVDFKADLNASFEMSDLGLLLIIWAYNLSSVMGVLLCVRQSIF